MVTKHALTALYQRLYQAYGPQHWWPGDSAFEIIVGAVLTQNTNWKNVEKAILRLKQANVLQLQKMHGLEHEILAEYIRSSGYFNVKSRRLKNLCAWMIEQGGVSKLSQVGTLELRRGLLSVNGVGPETADDILLYAFERPVFVIDAYTRRLLKSLNLIGGTEDYETLRSLFETRLEPEHAIYNEYHALIVRHAKEKCSGTADCRHCLVQGTEGPQMTENSI